MTMKLRAGSRDEPLIRSQRDGLSLRDDDKMPTLVGHFAVFNQWTEIDSWWEGHFLERIAPGSFLGTFREKRGLIKTLFQHGRDPVIGSKPLGMPSVLREDEKGAWAETPLIDAPYVHDVVAGVRAAAYGQSFSFRVLREEIEEEPEASDHKPRGLPERSVKEVELFEHGPVTWPAYADTTAGLRSTTLWTPARRRQVILGL